MIRVVLDTNVWDKLAEDEPARLRIRDMCRDSQLQIIVPRSVQRELKESPRLRGMPNWFAVTSIPDSVTVLGYSEYGLSRLGEGTTYKAHRGRKSAIADRAIVDAADTVADMYVSEDRRSRNQYERLKPGHASDYATFRAAVLSLTPAL